jgi:hypothetical protein
LPDEFEAELASLLGEAVGAAHADEPFAIAPDGGVLCPATTRLRIAPVRWHLPLHHAASKHKGDDDAWRAALAVAGCGGSVGSGVDPSIVLLDPIVGAMRHSATPTHRVGVIFMDGIDVLPLSVTWRIADAAPTDDDAPVEATRDLLQGRFMLDAPRFRAVQSAPWLEMPAVWYSQEERRACAELLATSVQEATRRASPGKAPAHPEPTSGALAPAAGLPPQPPPPRAPSAAVLPPSASPPPRGGGGGGGGAPLDDDDGCFAGGRRRWPRARAHAGGPAVDWRCPPRHAAMARIH